MAGTSIKNICCRVCGAKFTSFDDIEEDAYGTGFWCPECDGYTPYANSSRSSDIDLSVCLEIKGAKGNGCKNGKPKSILQERISPLRYPGGKGKMLKQLEPLFPDKVNTMVEPFAGGASASLAMLFAGRTDRIILNDLDKGVYAFWNAVLESTNELLDAVKGINGTREEFLMAKEILSVPDEHAEVELAAAFLVANQLAFSGITKAGIAGDYQRRWNYKKVADRIQKIAAYKDRITVTNKDALQIIEEYYWDEKNFLFVDPPYVLQGKRLYREWYETDDHMKLADLIRDLTLSYPGCAKIIVTYDACEETEELYDFPFAQKIYMERDYSCSRKKAGIPA